MVKTFWHYSRQTEAEKVAFTAGQTFNRFYPKSGFLVLPYPVKGNGRAVFFPDLKISPSLYRKLKGPFNFPFKKNKEILLKINAALEKKPLLKQADVDRLKKAWQEKEKDFWSELKALFPDKVKGVKNLEARPTLFGSLSSFNIFRPEKGEMVVYLRTDMDICHLAEAIVSSLLAEDLEKEVYCWNEREAVVDFLLTRTRMAKIFPRYKTTLSQVNGSSEIKLAEESKKYLAKMGISAGEIFALKEKEIWLEGKPLTNHLTSTEKEILLHLIKNKNRPCNWDSLAEVIWPEDSFDKYSSWAISKQIERLRKKIEELGISPWVIQNKRKEGYLLVD